MPAMNFDTYGRPEMAHIPVCRQPDQVYRSSRLIFYPIYIALFALLLLLLLSTMGDNSMQNNGSTRIVTLAAQTRAAQQGNLSSAQKSAAEKSYPHFSGSGMYIVGKDIQPGTYRTRYASPFCYYARLRGFSGEWSDIIGSNITDGPAIVTISAKDKGFQAESCATWTKDTSAITKSKTTFGDGTFFVGTDIKPGTYRIKKASTYCYYARLRSFNETPDDFVMSNITASRAIVTISAKDKGFRSSNCGTWVRV